VRSLFTDFGGSFAGTFDFGSLLTYTGRFDVMGLSSCVSSGTGAKGGSPRAVRCLN